LYRYGSWEAFLSDFDIDRQSILKYQISEQRLAEIITDLKNIYDSRTDNNFEDTPRYDRDR
jgi:hypothetical protein